MPTAAALLMIATVLAATEPAPEAAEIAATPDEATVTPGEAGPDEIDAEATGAGDPLYDRLFAEQESATAVPEASDSAPKLPPWLWIAGLAGLGGLYWLRQRQRQAQPKQGQVEVLGHTRMGTKSRLTVIRVPGEDGRMRRLLVSTGEGTPALVADLGSEADDAQSELGLPIATTTTSQPAATHGFHTVLDEAVGLEDDIIDDDEAELAEGEGLGLIPPPKVPVWNETPDEFTGAAEPHPAQPVQAEVPIAKATAAPPPVEASPAPTPLDALGAMLGNEDAPEMVMDVSWDPETGWRGLPDVAREPEQAAAPTADMQQAPAEPEAPEESWDELLLDQTSSEHDVLAQVGVKPSSRAAFEALLGGSRRQPADIPRNGRIRPMVHSVKPVRPWDQPSAHRTPYDDMLVDERDEVVQEHTPIEAGQPRSAADVHDLVAEVLDERDDPAPQPAAPNRGNGVVELARYLRRQVSP
jgi:hypothetical protein